MRFLLVLFVVVSLIALYRSRWNSVPPRNITRPLPPFTGHEPDAAWRYDTHLVALRERGIL
jgi:hypothetical protein